MRISEYLNEIVEIAGDINTEDIAKVVVILYEAWCDGCNIFLCGNGGSASTASHFACDLSKLGLRAYCLNDNNATTTAITNDSGFSELYIEQLSNKMSEGDVLVCISVHGCVGQDKAGMWSQNILKAMNFAQLKKAKIIGLVGFEGGIIRRLADASIKIRSFSTPQVESWHLHIAHLICQILSEYQPTKSCEDCQRVYPFDMIECPSCHSLNYKLVIGVIGNIEELKK